MNKFIFFVLMFLSTGLAKGQDSAVQIKAIKKEVVAINNSADYKKVTLQNEDFLENMTDGGGELTGYYEAGRIKKIHEWVGLSNGTVITEFYYKDDKLLFVFLQFSMYYYDENKNEFDLTKKSTMFEGRYYFNDRKIIEHTEKGKDTFVNDKRDAGSFLAQATDDLKLLNKKK